VCRAGREGAGYLGEWEHALALILACRHLPLQLLASPGEKAGKEPISDKLYLLVLILLKLGRFIYTFKR
jgi:hypothetical protein